jgi:UDP-N-acetyl-D-glucosamine dehydrogenase
VAVADHLTDSGAVVEFCDPHIADVNAQPVRFPMVDFTPESLNAADVVVVLVDHAEFDPEVIAANSALVFDAKNIMRDTAFTGEIL